jgi:hypothetical protein
MSLLSHRPPPPTPTPSPRRDLARAEAELGADHPLCKAERSLLSARRQLLGLVLFVLAFAVFAGSRDVQLVAEIGALAAAAVAARVLVALVVRNDRVLDAIADGLERVPLHGIRRRRARLLRLRSREGLARSLEERLAWATGSRSEVPYAARPMARSVVEAARVEIQNVVASLRGPSVAGARGVALCERLLQDAISSPLHGSDPEALRRELGRIRYLLTEASPRA